MLPEGQLWRHNQAGDLVHRNGRINRPQLTRLAIANAHNNKRGFTYTHHLVEGNTKTAKENRYAIALANLNGFTINLSANSLEHADRLAKLGVAPITTVVPENQTKNLRTPEGLKVVICPAVTKENVKCSTCKLCAIPDRKAIIAFPAHGFRKKSMGLTIMETDNAHYQTIAG